MGCNNRNNRHQNCKSILDIEVQFTGGNSTCNEQLVTTGMTLRQVLDILLDSCSNATVGGIPNFWFDPAIPIEDLDAKEGDFLMLYEDGAGTIFRFVSGEWVGTDQTVGGRVEWGRISGTITSQIDLVNYIAEMIGQIPPTAWGQITGNIEDQTDLINAFTTLGNNLRSYVDEQIDAIPPTTFGNLTGNVEDNQALVDYIANYKPGKDVFVDRVAPFALDDAVMDQTVIFRPDEAGAQLSIPVTPAFLNQEATISLVVLDNKGIVFDLSGLQANQYVLIDGTSSVLGVGSTANIIITGGKVFISIVNL